MTGWVSRQEGSHCDSNGGGGNGNGDGDDGDE